MAEARPGDPPSVQILRPVGTIPLPAVHGRIDHLALDGATRRLFVAALGNGTLEVVDLAAGSRVGEVSVPPEPQGVVRVAATGRIYVANGGGGVCQGPDDGSCAAVAGTEGWEDADNLRLDEDQGMLYVGFGDGALGVVDVGRQRAVGVIELAGHPESFQLEPHGSRIFVNVPSNGEIVVVDRARRVVTGHWSTGALRSNYPMALDASGRRLFVGFRHPPALGIFDTTSGALLQRLDCVGDADDLFVDGSADPARPRVYALGGAGAIEVFAEVGGDAGGGGFRRIQRVETSRGARTGLFDGATRTLYLAVPERAGHDAELRVFRASP